ncbi:hypothetical protein [Pseudomonas viridiflava]|uniref:hypothetical protein n=1 Tax=Pseudomonas viridiflava TaxID=33069 RepID=UPI000F02FFE0|nr:hypothetical protein [Pseudomonas viridiflava]
MANDTFAPIDGQRSGDRLEIYGRSPSGQFLPRLDFAQKLLRNINVYNVQINIASPDPTPIIEALRALPGQMQQKALLTHYDAIVGFYGHYLHLEDDEYLKKVFMLCAEHASKFESGLKDELAAIDPNQYSRHFEREKLEPLSSLCHVYLGLLTFNFHAMTILHPDRAVGEPVIQGLLDRVIGMLRWKLRETLRPGNRLRGSLLLETFNHPDSDRFERYLQYEDRDNSVRGVQRLIASVDDKKEWMDEVSFDRPKTPKDFGKLADKLIELIDKFESLLAAKANYRPTANGGPSFPLET